MNDLPMTQGPHYEVHVADNFHYRDSEAHYVAGAFATGEEALAKCRLIVEHCLEECAEAGRTSGEIYACYQSFGDDPFVLARKGAREISFSAWDYAKKKAQAYANEAGTG